MPTTAEQTQRRSIEFTTLDEVRADIEALAAGSYVTVGKWSYAQILDHLGSSLNASIDGFPFKGSWFVRWFVAPMIKNSILTNEMKPGFKLPKKFSSYLPTDDGQRRMDEPARATRRASHELRRADGLLGRAELKLARFAVFCIRSVDERAQISPLHSVALRTAENTYSSGSRESV